jgi:hypothetical protein
VTRIVISEQVWRDALGLLRACGAGKRECVVYLVGPAAAIDVVGEVRHPDHIASSSYYEIDPDWLHRFWLEAARSEISIRVQVHTHRGPAFHSDTDDGWPAVCTPGFLSLVLPRFALGDDCLEGAYLAELGPDGSWRRRAVEDRLQVAR